MGVDERDSQLDEIPELGSAPQSDQVRVILPRIESGLTRREDRLADPRKQEGGVVLVGSDVPLDAVEPGAAEGQRGESGTDLVPDGESGVILALRVGGDYDLAEPVVVPGFLEHGAAEGARLLLAPFVDLPTPGEPVSEDVVFSPAFQFRAHVALEEIAGVVRVVVSPPLVVVEEVLRHVPFAQRGDERVIPLDPHLRGGASFPARSRRLQV